MLMPSVPKRGLRLKRLAAQPRLSARGAHGRRLFGPDVRPRGRWPQGRGVFWVGVGFAVAPWDGYCGGVDGERGHHLHLLHARRAVCFLFHAVRLYLLNAFTLP